MNCKNCGADIPENGKFCDSCGAQVAQEEPKQDQQKPTTSNINCPSCGADVPKNGKFCDSCGAQVAQEEPKQDQQKPTTSNINCPSCGANVPENGKFCDSCGASISATTPVNQANTIPNNVNSTPSGNYTTQNNTYNSTNGTATKQNPLKKLSKVQIIIISAVLFVLIVVASLFGIYSASPAGQFSKLLEEGDIYNMYSIYEADENYDSLSDIDKWLLDMSVNSAMDKAINAGYDGMVGSVNSRDLLRELYYYPNEEISNKAYNYSHLYNGLYFYDIEDYESAVYNLYQIQSTELMTDDVREKYEESKIYYKEDILEETSETPSTQEELEDYLYILEDSMLYLGNDADIDARMKELETSFNDAEITQIEVEIQILIEDGYYESAFDLIEENTDILSENNELLSIYKSTVDSYVEYVQTQIDELVKVGNYDEAYDLIEDAIELLPEESEIFNDMQTKLQNEQPILLSDVEIEESKNVQNADPTEEITDINDETYQGENIYVFSPDKGKESYMKIELDKEYDKFIFTLAVEDAKSDIKNPISLIIYGSEDKKDKLKEIKTIDRDTKTKEIEIDVKGKEWLYISFEAEDEDSVKAILANASFVKSEILVVEDDTDDDIEEDTTPIMQETIAVEDDEE